MKLSILIPSLTERSESFNKLILELQNQIERYEAIDEVQILSLIDNREKSIGEKRNILLQKAQGKYCCFFDDDDIPASNYIIKILKAIEEDKDCCSFTGVITTNGENPETFEHSIKYHKWKTNDTLEPKYERYPNHLNVIKTEIAKQFDFLSIYHGEDYDWSTRIHQSGILKTEAFIEGVIYHYQYKTNK